MEISDEMDVVVMDYLKELDATFDTITVDRLFDWLCGNLDDVFVNKLFATEPDKETRIRSEVWEIIDRYWMPVELLVVTYERKGDYLHFGSGDKVLKVESILGKLDVKRLEP